MIQIRNHVEICVWRDNNTIWQLTCKNMHNQVNEMDLNCGFKFF